MPCNFRIDVIYQRFFLTNNIIIFHSQLKRVYFFNGIHRTRNIPSLNGFILFALTHWSIY